MAPPLAAPPMRHGWGIPMGRPVGGATGGCCRAGHEGCVGGHGYSTGQREKGTQRHGHGHGWLLGGHGTTHLSLTMARMCMRVCICKGMHTHAPWAHHDQHVHAHEHDAHT